MKIGLIGSGGREHALARVLARHPERDRLFVYAGHHNPGIDRLAAGTVTGALDDTAGILAAFRNFQVELVVIGPEAPLMAGAADVLRAEGIPVAAPLRAQARLESDKSFMRELMKKHLGWGAPQWALAHDRDEARRFIDSTGEVAVKPLGLTSGKGVKVMGAQLGSVDETLDYAESWIRQDGVVLLEERLVGEEFTRMVFASDGKMAPMPVAQDFKYALDGDAGPMTGGMGAYTFADGSLPFLRPAELAEADRLIEQALEAVKVETGLPYRGPLYGQFMLTAHGVRLIEFNVRFGDPEAINVLALLQSDAPHLFLQVALGELDAGAAVFEPQASVCKYLVPQVYPQALAGELLFDFDEQAALSAGLEVIYASMTRSGGRWRALGSRTLGVVGKGAEPGEISKKIEVLLAAAEPSALRHRRDVGAWQVIAQRVAHMQALREATSHE